MPRASIIFIASSLIFSGATHAAVNVFSSGGSDADVTASVNAFRTALGVLNPNNPQSFGGGRREINWDGVADTGSSPNAFDPNFFNAAVAPRARGAQFSTPGKELQVSADDSNPTTTPINFANIDPSYAAQFRAFSAQRLFTAIDSNITEMRFFLPGTDTPAAVSGFGAVFTDVDNNGSSHIELYDANNVLLRSAGIPRSAAGAGGFSFWGAQFDAGELITRVVIVSGTNALGKGVLDDPAHGVDLVAMDDFIYGEPQSVPAPGAPALLAIGGLLLARRRR